jgi:exopolyphosphatase/pppGpp-phosphohydrolase
MRSRISSDKALTLLHIDALQTIIATGTDVLVLPIGTGKTAPEFFHHAPPTPEEVENAINVVEDEVTRAYQMICKGSILCTTDNSIREIVHLTSVPDKTEMLLSREAMESLFTRLAALSMGRPTAKDDLRVNASFSATILVLREVMFHLGFKFINVIQIAEQN